MDNREKFVFRGTSCDNNTVNEVGTIINVNLNITIEDNNIPLFKRLLNGIAGFKKPDSTGKISETDIQGIIDRELSDRRLNSITTKSDRGT